MRFRAYKGAVARVAVSVFERCKQAEKLHSSMGHKMALSVVNVLISQTAHFVSNATASSLGTRPEKYAMPDICCASLLYANLCRDKFD